MQFYKKQIKTDFYVKHKHLQMMKKNDLYLVQSRIFINNEQRQED